MPESESEANSRAESARHTLRQFLKRRGIKFTAPRRRILEAVLEMEDHFEAEQLLFDLRQRGERVAKATIYRTLPLLVDCGILKQVRFEVKQAHYELCFGESPHDHMVCTRCGRIIEFSADEVIKLRARLAKEHGFHAVAHRFQLLGLCRECANQCPVATSIEPTKPAKNSRRETGDGRDG